MSREQKEQKEKKKPKGVEMLHGGSGTPFGGTVSYGGPTLEQVHLSKGLWLRDEEAPELVPPQRRCSHE